ncbi:LytTR family transcriptional regulator DNA-binding domain-containing protein [Mycoplasmatota bacterium]|nr:LytTR family transcriptional regulator DNA-binding domain-containing protein [Mycoplasmatota bacterium]
MKVKVICKKEKYSLYVEMLEKGGFTVSDEANLILKEHNFKTDSIVGKYNNRYEIIHYSDIIYVESFGHDINLHTLDKIYSIKEKLYEIEGIYQEKGFIRINKSCVVNKHQIKEIRPRFNTKLELLMNNKQKLEVTRSYYHQFKEFIGF